MAGGSAIPRMAVPPEAGRKRRKRFAAEGLRRHAFDPETKLCWRCGHSERAVVDGLIPCLEADNVLSIVPEIVRRNTKRRRAPGGCPSGPEDGAA